MPTKKALEAEIVNLKAQLLTTQLLFAVARKALNRAINLIDRLISDYVMVEDPSVVDLAYCFEASEVCGWPKCWFCGVQYMEQEGVAMLVPTAESLKGGEPGNELKFVCHVCANPKEESFHV